MQSLWNFWAGGVRDQRYLPERIDIYPSATLEMRIVQAETSVPWSVKGQFWKIKVGFNRDESSFFNPWN